MATLLAMANAWEFMLRPTIGMVNRTLEMACGTWFEVIPFLANGCADGFPLWLGDRDYAIWVVCFIGIWQGFGFNMVLFLAGLTSVHRELYHAAEMDGTNTVLREAVAGNLPDVTMQGLNRQAPLVDKGIAQSLEPFIAKEADFEKDGYHEAMLSLSTFNDTVYGLPFSVSLPVGYYNMDMMRQAGVESLPTTWDETIAACKTMKANGIERIVTGDATDMKELQEELVEEIADLLPNG